MPSPVTSNVLQTCLLPAQSTLRLVATSGTGNVGTANEIGVGAKPLPVKMEMVQIVTHEDGTQEEIVVTSEGYDSHSAKLTFTLTPPAEGWAKGDYQVRLYLDGEKKQALDFKIK